MPSSIFRGDVLPGVATAGAMKVFKHFGIQFYVSESAFPLARSVAWMLSRRSASAPSGDESEEPVPKMIMREHDIKFNYRYELDGKMKCDTIQLNVTTTEVDCLGRTRGSCSR